jgi:Zn-dependent M28 family amino/carboxypeptidase
MDFEDLARRATGRGFRAVPLNLRASVVLRNTIARSRSANVIGYVRGTARPDETVLFMAHWDHLGRDPDLEGDQIYNGAVDNATGTAALIALARSFAAGGFPRSIVFAALTAEESGLLGSAYYADHPLFPLETTVAALNIDGMNVLGPTRDVVVIGWGQSELEDVLARAAAEQDRVTVPEPSPEKGYFYRSDHFNLAKKGVPVLYAESGVDHRARGADWGRARSREYLREHYHKPSDEYDPDWDLAGALEDMALYREIGRELAAGGAFPRWRAGSEFRAIRETSARRREARP